MNPFFKKNPPILLSKVISKIGLKNINISKKYINDIKEINIAKKMR